MKQWLAASRRKPLVIRGTRQVGKSTLVKLFCEAAGRPLVAVDLERQPELAAAFGRVKAPRSLLASKLIRPRPVNVVEGSIPWNTVVFQIAIVAVVVAIVREDAA